MFIFHPTCDNELTIIIHSSYVCHITDEFYVGYFLHIVAGKYEERNSAIYITHPKSQAMKALGTPTRFQLMDANVLKLI